MKETRARRLSSAIAYSSHEIAVGSGQSSFLISKRGALGGKCDLLWNAFPQGGSK